MLRYFPFSESFDLKMGTSPLKDSHSIIEWDEHYREEVASKRKLLTEDHSYYYRELPSTQPAQWEVLEKVLLSLSSADPQNFILTTTADTWSWENKLLNEKQTFRLGETKSLPLSPLDWAGRQIQEDLIILKPDLTLVSGQLCFPSGWDLNEKIGKHFLSIHSPLPPLLNPMIDMADKFIQRLPSGKSFQRNNWGFRVSDQLDLSSRHSESYRTLLTQISSELNEWNAGEKLFIRIEHQTLSRLPSGYILFTIHTYQNLLSEEAMNKERSSALYHFLKTVPDSLLEYKLMTPFITPLLAYLHHHTARE